jgi:biopolymer transport protein ExbB/TolQ
MGILVLGILVLVMMALGFVSAVYLLYRGVRWLVMKRRRSSLREGLPTAKQLQDLLELHKLTASAAARMLRVDRYMIRRWMRIGTRPVMPWAFWILLKVLVGEAD